MSVYWKSQILVNAFLIHLGRIRRVKGESWRTFSRFAFASFLPLLFLLSSRSTHWILKCAVSSSRFSSRVLHNSGVTSGQPVTGIHDVTHHWVPYVENYLELIRIKINKNQRVCISCWFFTRDNLHSTYAINEIKTQYLINVQFNCWIFFKIGLDGIYNNNIKISWFYFIPCMNEIIIY